MTASTEDSLDAADPAPLTRTDILDRRIELRDRLAFRPEELPGLLGLGRSTIYAALKSGELPSKRVGRRLIVPRAALEAFLEAS